MGECTPEISFAKIGALKFLVEELHFVDILDYVCGLGCRWVQKSERLHYGIVARIERRTVHAGLAVVGVRRCFVGTDNHSLGRGRSKATLGLDITVAGHYSLVHGGRRCEILPHARLLRVYGEIIENVVARSQPERHGRECHYFKNWFHGISY